MRKLIQLGEITSDFLLNDSNIRLKLLGYLFQRLNEILQPTDYDRCNDFLWESF